MKKDPPDFQRIHCLFEQNRAKFDEFYRFLLEQNAAFNLTAIVKEEEVFHKHFLDSLAGEQYLERGARVAEVGSGAGFPSVPLLLVREDVNFTLIESTGKKCAFLKKVVEKFHLNAEVVQMRAEEAGKDAAFREQFDVVVARAVAPLAPLCEYCLPLVKVGGEMIAWKGSEDEAPSARSAALKLGGEGLCSVFYELPAGYGARSLVFCKKVRPTPAAYPRGQGKERKQPL